MAKVYLFYGLDLDRHRRLYGLGTESLPKSLLGTSIWTHLLVEKFHGQRPMHRTLEGLRLSGLDLAAGTITDGLKRIAPLMLPIYEGIQIRQARSKYLNADELSCLPTAPQDSQKRYGVYTSTQSRPGVTSTSPRGDRVLALAA